MYLGFKFRLYPNASQRTLLAKHFGCARFAYNYALALKIKTWETEHKNLSQFELCKVFPVLKKQEGTEWLAEVCSHSLQCEMANLDMAFTRFFREKKGFPQFKSKHDRKSYSTNVNIAMGPGFVRLPKLGVLKAVISRKISGRITTATVSQTPTGKYFVSLLCDDGVEAPTVEPAVEETTLGIDLGIKHFATFSTGEKVENPKHLQASLRKLRRAQRKLSRRAKGSNNRRKQARVLASIHEKVVNRRKDFQHKLSTRIIRENQAIALETLDVSGMQNNHKMSRAIGDAGWSQFVSMLEYKAARRGRAVMRIGQFEPSSRLCTCGEVNRELKLSDRVWTCRCGQTHDRDVLAASNIKRMAFHSKQQSHNSIPADSREFTPAETLNRESLKQESQPKG